MRLNTTLAHNYPFNLNLPVPLQNAGINMDDKDY